MSEHGKLTVALALLVVMVMLPNLLIYRSEPGRDSGGYLYAGWRILSGDILYRDVWDHKPPVTHSIDALGLLIGRGSTWGVLLIEFLSLFCAAMLGLILARRLFGTIPAIFGSVAWLVGLVLVLDGGNLPEEFALPFQFGALYLFWRCEERGTYAWRGFLIGVTGAVALLLRPNLAGVWCAIAFLLILRFIFTDRRRRAASAMASIFTGAASLLIIVGLYFLVHGALRSFIDQVLRYNLAYSAATFGQRAKALVHGLRILSQSGITIMALGGWVAGIIYMRRDGEGDNGRRGLLLLLLIALPMEFILSSVSGRTYNHYYITWLPCFAMLSSFLAFSLTDRTVRQESKLAPPVAILLKRPGSVALFSLLAAMCVLPATVLFHQLTVVRDAVERSSRKAVAAYIEGLTGEDDCVLVWGAEPAVNFLARRRAPGGLHYQYPLYTRGYHEQAMVRKIIGDIAANRPALIIDTSPTNMVIPPIDPDARKKWASPAGPYGLPPGIESLFDFITTQYSRAGTIGAQRWEIYVRNEK